MSAKPTHRDAIYAQVQATVQRSGVRAALVHLLMETDYRYIGIFRFEGGMATAAVHYDRENPDQLRIAEVPQNTTYCYFIKESHGVFTTPNALADERLVLHPARTTVQSYCGVPILDREGMLLGSLCCYDVVPRSVEQVDMGLMMRVANMLAEGHHVPAYPKAAGTAAGQPLRH